MFFLGRDPGTLKSDIVSKRDPQLICSDLRLKLKIRRLKLWKPTVLYVTAILYGYVIVLFALLRCLYCSYWFVTVITCMLLHCYVTMDISLSLSIYIYIYIYIYTYVMVIDLHRHTCPSDNPSRASDDWAKTNQATKKQTTNNVTHT